MVLIRISWNQLESDWFRLVLLGTCGAQKSTVETELENKLAAKDVAPVETSEEAEPPVSVEDFVSRSG